MNFPVKNLELKDFIPLPGGGADVEKKDSSGQQMRSKYDLIANIVHDGKPGEGSYRVYVQRKSEETWYSTVLFGHLLLLWENLLLYCSAVEVEEAVVVLFCSFACKSQQAGGEALLNKCLGCGSNGSVVVYLCLHVRRYELQDLHRIETLPQMVALSEAYIQFYEQQDQQ